MTKPVILERQVIGVAGGFVVSGLLPRADAVWFTTIFRRGGA